ncbi:MAG: hypothetical protein O2942_09280 [Proteobacteria bacterium]|nr:hypothetical protein [Pseudomonadota bacterium]
MEDLQNVSEAIEANFPPEKTVGRRPEVFEGGKFASDIKAPPTEVKPAKKHRRFTASYKMKILQAADNCSKSGDIAILLRQEGLYSSHLTCWRKQRKHGEFEGLSSKKPGVKAKDSTATCNENKQLKRENDKLKKQLEKAQIIIDFQKKTYAILQMINQQDEKI